MTQTRVADTRTASEARPRVVALDALRGLAVVVLVGVNTAGVRDAMPYQLSHPDWHGFTFADQFFPVFLFTMGAAMAFSTRAASVRTALRRVALLFAFGVGLSLLKSGSFATAGVLQKIAVAYLLAWLVTRLPERFHVPATVAILGLHWAAFAAVGSWEPRENFAHHLDSAIHGHWSTEGFTSAIPATVSALGGLIVFRSVLDREPRDVLLRVVAWSAASIVVGLALSAVVPLNKRLWTPSFTILSHGAACAYLGVFWCAQIRGWTMRPLVVLGRNPILLYVLATATHVLLTPVREPIAGAIAGVTTPLAASLIWSGTMTVLAWLLADALDRRKLYLRV